MIPAPVYRLELCCPDCGGQLHGDTVNATDDRFDLLGLLARPRPGPEKRDHTMTLSTFDADQPWVVYRFGLDHDGWWPAWNSTRFKGSARIVCVCAVCGTHEIIRIRVPRFGRPPRHDRHPERVRFLAEHAHPDRGNPMSWALPLLNPAAHPGGISLDLLAMRLEADLNEQDPT